jgi:hypothetical protein
VAHVSNSPLFTEICFHRPDCCFNSRDHHDAANGNPSGSSSTQDWSSLVRLFYLQLLLPTASQNDRIHGSTTSVKPVRSSANPSGWNRCPPNAANRASSWMATWLQSWAVVVCRSRSKLESPRPKTAYWNTPRFLADDSRSAPCVFR